MAARGGVVVTAVLPVSPPIVALPATVGTLPVFTVAGATAKISDSRVKQHVNGGITLGGVLPANTDGVTIGTGANSQGFPTTGPSISIGQNASASVVDGIAIGRNSMALSGTRHIAIGTGAKASGGGGAADNISIGTMAGYNNTQIVGGAISIGNGANANGYDLIAIGTGSLSTQGIAIGPNAAVTHSSAVSIGRSAVSTQAGEVTFGTTIFGGLQVTLFSVRPAAGTPVRHRNSADGWCIRDLLNANDIFKVDESAVADDVRLLLWDVTAGVLKRVTRGAADSGGGGYRALRIAN